MPLVRPERALVSLAATATGGHSPADSTTYYFSAYTGFNPATLPITASPHMTRAGRVRRAYIRFSVYGTKSSTEQFTVSVRNDSAGTTEAISSTFQLNATDNEAANNAMSLAFSAGDILAIQFTTPAWVTNPTVVIYNATIEVELY